MEGLRKRLGAVASFGITFVCLASTPAWAHTVRDYIPHTWATASDNTIDYWFQSDVPAGSFRDRVRNGADQWNAIGGGSEPDFVAAGEASNLGNPDSCNRTANGIFYRQLDLYGAGVLGAAITCVDGFGSIKQFTISFDTDPDWYTGTGDADDGFLNLCLTGCATDTWSIATHEWGHVAGFLRGPNDDGHFDSGDAVCDDDTNQESMCPFYKGGTERWRTTEPHDEHTFDGAYQ